VIVGAVVALAFAVKAARRSLEDILEDIAEPLSSRPRAVGWQRPSHSRAAGTPASAGCGLCLGAGYRTTAVHKADGRSRQTSHGGLVARIHRASLKRGLAHLVHRDGIHQEVMIPACSCPLRPRVIRRSLTSCSTACRARRLSWGRMSCKMMRFPRRSQISCVNAVC
jgi:hypothetical protein